VETRYAGDFARTAYCSEQRLDAAPENLPPGLRAALIGEIYRARYNIALFGGTQGITLLNGLQFSATA